MFEVIIHVLICAFRCSNGTTKVDQGEISMGEINNEHNDGVGETKDSMELQPEQANMESVAEPVVQEVNMEVINQKVINFSYYICNNLLHYVISYLSYRIRIVVTLIRQ